MSTFECCRTKTFPSSYYICVNCTRVFHRSCVLRDKLKYNFLGCYKIKCCERMDETEALTSEKSLLEETISELNENSTLREQYLKKLKEDHLRFAEEVSIRENELNTLIKNQEDKIKTAYREIDKLKKDISSFQTEKIVCTNSTQTTSNKLATRQTQTEILCENKIHPCLHKHDQITKKDDMHNCTPNKPVSRKVTLVSGNHGKDLANILTRYLDAEFSVFSIIKPDASNNELVETAFSLSKDLTKNDFMVFWPNVNSSQLSNNLMYRLKHTNVMILTSPSRYDLPELNENIYSSNLSLYKNIHSSWGNLTSLLNVDKILRRSNYDYRGIHLRKSGKRYLALHIANEIKIKLRLGFKTSTNLSNENIGNHNTVSPAMNINLSTKEITSDNSRDYFLYPRLSQIAPMD